MSIYKAKAFWAVCLLGVSTGLLAEHFSYDAGDIRGSRTSNGGISYILSVTKGNLNTSYDFDTRKGVTSGTPTGMDISVSSGGATGTISYGADSLPTADFTISMNGKLIPPGEGEGSQPTWSASGTAKAPFHIQSNQSGNAKNITVPAGTSVTYTAYEGSSSTKADWNVNGESKTNESSIIFNRSWWDVPAWFDASMGTPKPGIYDITAKPTGKSSPRDSGVMTVVGAEFQKGYSQGWDDFTEWNNGAADYYSATPTGKCDNPYFAVENGMTGSSSLVLTPSPCHEILRSRKMILTLIIYFQKQRKYQQLFHSKEWMLSCPARAI